MQLARPHSFAASASIVALVAATLLTPATPAFAAGTSTQGTWKVLEATILDDSGAAIPNAHVSAYAYPTDVTGATISTQLVAEGTADSAGNISLAGTLPTPQAAYVHDDQTIQVEFDVIGTSTFAQYQLNVPVSVTSTASLQKRMARSAPVRQTKISTAGVSTSASGTLVFHALGLPSRVKRLVPARPAGGEANVAVADPDDPTVSQTPDSIGTTSGFGCQDGYSPTYIKQSSYVDHQNKIQHLHTGSYAHIGYYWDNSSSTTFASVFNASGDIQGVPYQISIGHSAEDASSSGLSHTAATHTNEYMFVTWRWYEYKKYCSGNFSYNQGLHYTGSWEWRPIKWTGGDGVSSTTAAFTCNTKYLTTVGLSTWVAKSSSKTTSGAATLAGISVSSGQTNSSTHKLTITPISGHSAKICGSNNTILDAAQIEEVG